MTEEWRNIPGYPWHQASNLGRVRSLDKVVNCRNGSRTVKGQILISYVTKWTGYAQVSILRKNVSAHRLVALAWCPGFTPGLCVDHLNGIRTDNRPDNLEWVTASENAQRSVNLGRRKNPYQGKFSAAHPASKAVISTNIQTGVEREFAAAMDAAREGFNGDAISRCCTNKATRHKGHTWRFKSRAEKGVVWTGPEAEEKAA